MLDQVRIVLNHHGSGRRPHHHDTPVERHQHEAGSSDVVTLDDDAANTDSGKTPAGKRLAADLDTPTLTVGAAVTSFAVTAARTEPPSDFESHVDDLLERPPR